MNEIVKGEGPSLSLGTGLLYLQKKRMQDCKPLQTKAFVMFDKKDPTRSGGVQRQFSANDAYEAGSTHRSIPQKYLNSAMGLADFLNKQSSNSVTN